MRSNASSESLMLLRQRRIDKAIGNERAQHDNEGAGRCGDVTEGMNGHRETRYDGGLVSSSR